MQDDSNLDDPSDKSMSAKQKFTYIYPGHPPKSRSYAKKKHFTINFICLIHKACQILSTFTNQCHCLHFHSQCLHLPHTHS